jgi:hypothetical protein
MPLTDSFRRHESMEKPGLPPKVFLKNSETLVGGQEDSTLLLRSLTRWNDGNKRSCSDYS